MHHKNGTTKPCRVYNVAHHLRKVKIDKKWEFEKERKRNVKISINDKSTKQINIVRRVNNSA